MDQTPTPPPGDAPPPPAPQSSAPPPPPSAPPPPPAVSFTPPAEFTAPAGGYPTTSGGPKNPVLSLVLSLILPGLGQIINGETGKGIALIVGWVISFFLLFVLIGFLTGLAVWAFAAWDAFQGAKKYNVAHGFPPGA